MRSSQTRLHPRVSCRLVKAHDGFPLAARDGLLKLDLERDVEERRSRLRGWSETSAPGTAPPLPWVRRIPWPSWARGPACSGSAPRRPPLLAAAIPPSTRQMSARERPRFIRKVSSPFSQFWRGRRLLPISLPKISAALRPISSGLAPGPANSRATWRQR